MNKHQLAGKKTWEGKTKEDKKAWSIEMNKKRKEKYIKDQEILRRLNEIKRDWEAFKRKTKTEQEKLIHNLFD